MTHCEQLLPPGGVTHCAAAHLLSKAELSSPQLVVIKGTLLEVFAVQERLELVTSQQLHGSVESIAVLRTSAVTGVRDALLLTFREAKLAVLTWDLDLQELTCSSLHYFEGDKALKAGRELFPIGAKVIADPEGRCAAVIFFRHQLAVLPAMENEAASLGVDEGLKEASASLANSYVDNLAAGGVREVRDAAFLQGYNTPVLLLLHEGDATWAGNLTERKDTCALTALSLNLSSKKQSKIWGFQNLPSDCFLISSTPSGGALVFGLHTVLYYSQGQQSGIILNSAAIPSGVPPPPLEFDLMNRAPGETAARYAREHGLDVNPSICPTAVEFCTPKFAGLNLECDAAKCVWLNELIALVGLKSGQLLILKVEHKSGTVVFDAAKAGTAPVITSATLLTPDLLFLGSMHGDSLLVSLASVSSIGDEPAMKRQKIFEALEEEEQFVYGIDTGAVDSDMPRYKMHVIDSLPNCGPINDMSIVQIGMKPEENSPFLLTCSGHGQQGSLMKLRYSLAPDVITRVPLAGILGVWAVHQRKKNEGRDEKHAYLLLGFKNSTKILSTGGELQEVTEKVQFIADERTIGAGSIHQDRYVVQVYPQGLRLLEEGCVLQDVSIGDMFEGECIIKVDIRDPYISLLLSENKLALLKVSNTGKVGLCKVVPVTKDVTHCCLYFEPKFNEVVAVISKLNGRLEVRTLANWTLKLSYDSLAEGAALLRNLSSSESPRAGLHLKEVQMEYFDRHTMLVAMTSDNRLVAYKLDPRTGSLKRIMVAVPPLFTKASGPVICRFHGLGEQLKYDGFFIAGKEAWWLIVSRGTLISHPHQTIGAPNIRCFTPFHNVNCPHGFIISTSDEGPELVIAQLPARTRLDAPWSRQKIALKATPKRIAFYPEAQLCAVLVSKQGPYTPFLPEEEGGEPQASYAYALTAAAAAAKGEGAVDRDEVRLIDPNSWLTIWRQSFHPGERALAVHVAHLRDSTTGATIPLIAIGVGFVAGEDYPCNGRVLLFEISRDGNNWTGRLVYSREYKGPVTALAVVEGCLLLSTGNRIETCVLRTSTASITTGDDAGAHQTETTYTLLRSAFYEGPMLIVSLQVVKNYILVGDIHQSVHFIHCTDDGKQLRYLGKDFSRVDVGNVQFLIEKSTLSLVLSDTSGTFRLLSYDRRHPESWQGERLMPWGAFHIGDHIQSMLRVQLGQPSTEDSVARQGVLYGTATGCIGILSPLAILETHKVSASVLQTVQQALVTGLVHAAGLNPMAFRRRYGRIAPGAGGGCMWQKPLPLQGVVDGDLLYQISKLPLQQQEQFAANAGVSLPALLASLVDQFKAFIIV